MKRVLGVCLAAAVVLAIAGCATKGPAPSNAGRAVASNVPQFVKDAIKNVPEGSIVAVASSNLRNTSLAKQAAETRARGEIARQLEAVVASMIRDYATSSEAIPDAELSITEALNTSLAKQTLHGAMISGYEIIDGITWLIVEMPKDGQRQTISSAASAAKLAPAWVAAMDAEERMNKALAQNGMSDVPVVGD
jgi:hypothetical protein